MTEMGWSPTTDQRLQPPFPFEVVAEHTFGGLAEINSRYILDCKEQYTNTEEQEIKNQN